MTDLPLTVCWSCRRPPQLTVLAILTSPAGPYALCRSCLGRDAELQGPRTPAEIPAPPPAVPRAPATPPQPTPTQAPLERSWDRLRDTVARRDAERRTRSGR